MAQLPERHSLRTLFRILVQLSVFTSTIPAFRCNGTLSALGGLPGWVWVQYPHLGPRSNCPPLPSPQGLEQDVLQAIDRAIEAVHNAAMRDGGKYSLEQRGVLQ